MLLILDVDGVLTDGKKYYDNTGKGVYKTFNDRDFTAIKKFKAAGIPTVFLSGDENINAAVAKNRNIPFYHSRPNGKMLDKATFIPLFEKEYNIPRSKMIYVGDDIFDISIMLSVGYAFCPYDAAKEVKEICYVLDNGGGFDCVSEIYNILKEKQLIKAPTIEQVITEDLNEKF